ncbi:hypothetical protein MAP00_000368 [Monascus purpureus]|nr:hypothetical protein MAP00_000368 [Monascus purpureus]
MFSSLPIIAEATGNRFLVISPWPHSLAANMSLSPAAAKGEIAIGKEELGESSPRSSSTRNSPATPRSRPVVFRGTLFQILLVGFCTFCAPGIWSAMNGLGVGGSQSPGQCR